nr:hypothetical protein [Patescibacteria group bacterium]
VETLPATAPEPALVPEVPKPQVTTQAQTSHAPLSLSNNYSVPTIDVRYVTNSLVVVFGGFVSALLILDVWYARKHDITRLTGHALAHLVFLLIAVAGVLVSLSPGVVL